MPLKWRTKTGRKNHWPHSANSSGRQPPINSHRAASGRLRDARIGTTPRATSHRSRLMQAELSNHPIVPTAFRGDYWQQSRRPLASLAFVTPLLLVYEAGVLWLGPQAMRNGADVWLRQLLDLMGFSQYFLLPLLTLGLLSGWHYVSRQP